MRLPKPSLDRFVVEDSADVRPKTSRRQYEKPFTLADKRFVPSPMQPAGLDLELRLPLANGQWLERLKRRPNAQHGSLLRQSRHEPMPLVVAAQKLVLSIFLLRHQQQVPNPRLSIQNPHVGQPRLSQRDVEELAFTIVADIDHHARAVVSRLRTNLD